MRLTTRLSIWSQTPAITRTLKLQMPAIARLILAGALLTVASAASFAGTITSFSAIPGGCSTIPPPSTGGNSFGVSLGTGGCGIRYNFVGGPVTNYPLLFAITNNTGQTMTDLHFQLFQSSTPATILSNPFTAGPLVLTGSTGQTLDFNLGSPLIVGSTQSISMNLTLSSLNQNGFDTIQITPSFNTPEPSSLALTLGGAILVGTRMLRRRVRTTNTHSCLKVQPDL